MSRFCISLRSCVLLLVMTTTAAQPAAAQSVCVRCTGPDQSYSCSLAPDAPGAAPRGKALQYNCIQEIARTYSHERCQVKQHDIGSCPGQVHMVSGLPPAAPAVGLADRAGSDGADRGGLNSGPASAPSAPQQQADPLSSQPKQQREPATVVELAKRAANNTDKEIRRSAETVSNAAKSTWRCLSTFFSDC